MTRVLLVGLNPEAVDYSDPALPPGMNAKKIQAAIDLGLKQMTDRGWRAEACLIQHDATAGPAVERRLSATTYDCVVIGAGVRLPPKSLFCSRLSSMRCTRLRRTPQLRSTRCRRIARTQRLAGCPPLVRSAGQEPKDAFSGLLYAMVQEGTPGKWTLRATYPDKRLPPDKPKPIVESYATFSGARERKA